MNLTFLSNQKFKTVLIIRLSTLLSCVSFQLGMVYHNMKHFNCFLISDLNMCRNPLCQNGGTCINTVANDYRCDCMPGYTDKNCQTGKYFYD